MKKTGRGSETCLFLDATQGYAIQILAQLNRLTS
jgi:hypothetical protein